MNDIPEQALACGFAVQPVGSHTSRTIMLPELRTLFSVCPIDATPDAYRRAIVDDNLFGKDTRVTRERSYRHLRELYALDPDTQLFRAMRDLWDADPEAQPLLAMICAVGRDPLLRVTTPLVLDALPGQNITPEECSAAVERAWPGRYKPSGLRVTGRNILGSWRQSGHVSPSPSRARASAECRPTAVAYAAFLGHLCGARGELLFDTLWARLLDRPAHTLHEQTAAASRQGWLEYRHAGGVTEISFRRLLGDRQAR